MINKYIKEYDDNLLKQETAGKRTKITHFKC